MWYYLFAVQGGSKPISLDETLVCDHSDKAIKQHFDMVLFT